MGTHKGRKQISLEARHHVLDDVLRIMSVPHHWAINCRAKHILRHSQTSLLVFGGALLRLAMRIAERLRLLLPTCRSYSRQTANILLLRPLCLATRPCWDFHCKQRRRARPHRTPNDTRLIFSNHLYRVPTQGCGRFSRTLSLSIHQAHQGAKKHVNTSLAQARTPLSSIRAAAGLLQQKWFGGRCHVLIPPVPWLRPSHIHLVSLVITDRHCPTHTRF